MAKAILVIDMPENCEECRMARLVNGNQVMCCIDRMVARSYSDATEDRPDWCPLVPMPNGKNWGSGTLGELHYCRGWNAAIDAIGGKKSDRE